MHFAYAFSNALLPANVIIKLELDDKRDIWGKIIKTNKAAGNIQGAFSIWDAFWRYSAKLQTDNEKWFFCLSSVDEAILQTIQVVTTPFIFENIVFFFSGWQIRRSFRRSSSNVLSWSWQWNGAHGIREWHAKERTTNYGNWTQGQICKEPVALVCVIESYLLGKPSAIWIS